MSLNRREAIQSSLVAASFAGLPQSLSAASGKLATVATPRVCGLENPLALGDLQPRFSWVVTDGHQTAYRIRVAASADELTTGAALMWDSGRVSSSASVDVVYAGPALPAGKRAVWQVDIWTSKSPHAQRSAPAFWETGLGEWRADWLASETETARIDRTAGLHWITGEGALKAEQVRAFRWSFDAHEAGPAELCLSAHETMGVWLDGASLASPPDAPVNWTQMTVHDLLLAKGRHVVAVVVKRKLGFGVAPPMLAALLRHGPGKMQRLTSADAGWTSTIAPADGWQAPGFDETGWAPARAANAPLPIGEPWPAYPASRLRRAFSVTRPVRRARLHATALGCYEASLNGATIGDRKLAPEFTDPSKRILFQTHDVTDALVQGDNVLGFEVGDGWYGSKFSTSGRFAFGPAPCRLLAQLDIEYDDGSHDIISTGPGWQIGDSPVRAASIYDGEVFDARLDQPDWTRAGSSQRGWRMAERIDPPVGIAIHPQRCPPIRVHETLRPVAIARIAAGRYVADFGQNFAGWPRLSVSAPAGSRIAMRFAEICNPDGTIDQSNLRTALARDIYIAAGRGREVWEPRFTYHGFRYVELRGVPDNPGDWSLEGLVGYQDLALTGQMRVGDPVIQKFWENSVWSQKSNFFGLPTDCPQRDERLGWMGDAQIFWPAASFNMDTQAFSARVAEDLRITQSRAGGFMDCIPPFVPGAASSSPGWADAGVVLPHTAFWQFGDTGVVDANWDAMERYMAWIANANPDHLWKKGRGFDYGDWLSVDAPDFNPGLATTPKDLIATTQWARNASLMVDMAKASGRDSRPWQGLFGQISAAFNAAYVKPDGTVGNGSQTGHVLAIRFGLLSPSAKTIAGERLAADIARRGMHLSTGFLGTPHILDALVDAGQARTAIGLLIQRSAPSWGYMVTKGATTMWERWNSDQGDVGMNSRNHYAFGAIGSFLFRRIAGIDPVAPGFAHLRVAPVMDARLGSGGATYHSVRGTIRTDWTAKDGRFQLDLELPTAIDAKVHLPAGNGHVRIVTAKPGLNRFSGRVDA